MVCLCSTLLAVTGYCCGKIVQFVLLYITTRYHQVIQTDLIVWIYVNDYMILLHVKA